MYSYLLVSFVPLVYWYLIFMISFKNVSKLYTQNGRESVALERINFKIQPHEFVSVVGRSGAGKSTIIKLLVGEEKPTRGQIFLANMKSIN